MFHISTWCYLGNLWPVLLDVVLGKRPHAPGLLDLTWLTCLSWLQWEQFCLGCGDGAQRWLSFSITGCTTVSSLCCSTAKQHCRFPWLSWYPDWVKEHCLHSSSLFMTVYFFIPYSTLNRYTHSHTNTYRHMFHQPPIGDDFFLSHVGVWHVLILRPTTC